MANHFYTNQNSLSSSIDDPYISEQSSLIPPPRYLSSDPLFSSYSRFRTPLSSADIAAVSSGIGVSSRTFFPTSAASPIWPSFDVSSAATKRSSEALYDHSVLHAHMIGQNDAWLTSNSLLKRPRVESASNLPTYPLRPGEKDCTHYMRTRTCKFGETCKFDHPIWVPEGGIPDWKEPPSVPYDSHPVRPGEPDCQHFIKTQKCKFGPECKFNHPKDLLDTSGKTDAPDLPERPSEPLCTFYAKTGICKYGAACKYHHPKDIQVPSDGQEKETADGMQGHGSATGDGDAVKTFSSNSASSYNSKGLPMRPGQDDCQFYMKTGSCKYGFSCRYNHPDWNAINPTAAVIGHAVLPSLSNSVGLVNGTASFFQPLQSGLAQTTFGQVSAIYPQRPGQMECDYYMKNGECKFGERCKYHHPIDRAAPTRNQSFEQNVKFTLAGLPRREGVQHCSFYMKTSTCRYGASCKYDHPPPGEVMASAEQEMPTKGGVEEKENGENEEQLKNGHKPENVNDEK